MKKAYFSILLFAGLAYGQANDTIKINDLQIPNSPSLTLLDKSFSVIETVNSPNVINADLVNIKDNSIEITPYWLINQKKQMTVKQYYGVDTNNGQNYFSNVKKLSVSVSYAPTDTLTTVALGVRCNLINIKRKNAMAPYINYDTARKAFINGIDPVTGHNRLADLMASAAAPTLSGATVILSDQYDAQNTALKKKALDDSQDALATSWFNIDLATAVSGFFPGNDRSGGRFGRYGFWTNVKLEASSYNNNKNFINLYGFARILKDRTQPDLTNGTYTEYNFTDIGGKLEFRFNKFSVSGEYVNRKGDNIDYRLVGMLEYKIRDNIYINGGYGKDFEDANGNLATLVGIKWGFTEKSKVQF